MGSFHFLCFNLKNCLIFLGLSAFTFAYRNLLLKVKKWSNRVKQEQQPPQPKDGHGNHYYWCTMDMANCFTTIDHDLMRRILEELLPSER